MREADPNLRYQPVFEIRDPKRKKMVRAGAHVLSYHILAPYVGWAAFQIELNEAIDGLFKAATQTFRVISPLPRPASCCRLEGA